MIPAGRLLPSALVAVAAVFVATGCGKKTSGPPEDVPVDPAAVAQAISASSRIPGASRQEVWTADQLTFLETKFGALQTLPSGLKFKVLQPGAGTPPPRGKKVSVHYEGRFLSDQVFDSSRKRGKPLGFRVGTAEMIKGFDEAVGQMTKGEKRLIVVPYWLGYGATYHGPIPPLSVLVFEIELLDWVDTVGIPSSQS